MADGVAGGADLGELVESVKAGARVAVVVSVGLASVTVGGGRPETLNAAVVTGLAHRIHPIIVVACHACAVGGHNSPIISGVAAQACEL